MMSASSILVIVRVGAGISVVPCKKHARFMFLIVVCGHL
jgi:hypothetical protein